MTSVEVWVIILGGGAITYGLRMVFLAIVPASRLPEQIRQALRFVPPAVLAGIAIPQLVVKEAGPTLNPADPQQLAGAAAILIGVLLRNPWVTIAGGLLALWLFSL